MSTRTLDHVCEKCRRPFQSPRTRQRFCSRECSDQPNRSTVDQYSKLDGNLSGFLNRLLYKDNHRAGKSRESITRDQLMDLWQKQNGRCAISGIPMTFRAVRDELFPFNVSIDCITPRSKGGRYEIGNIQLVISLMNSLMKAYPKDDVIRACVAVADKWRATSSVANS